MSTKSGSGSKALCPLAERSAHEGKAQVEGEEKEHVVPQYDDDNWDDEDDTEFGDEQPRNESAAMKQMRKQIKEQARQIKELSSENTGLKSSFRERTVTDVLSAKGINPKVAKLIPSDIEPTEEAVSQWVTDYADVFGFTTADAPAAEEAETPEEAPAFGRMRQVEGSSSPSEGAGALQQKLANANNVAEVMALIRQGG